MARSTTFASFAFLAGLAAAPALAQAPADLAYRPAQGVNMLGGNVAGGGVATISGGGDDGLITYSRGGAGGGASFDRPGRVATFAGNDGDGPAWTYAAPAEASPGRQAWIMGGGDDRTVVYANPSGRR
ncbi:hypothetical protein E2C06_12545 [Dankookia rubra]|uniref:Uncharacterized protein n=1 Tax=Dankookia rubra TaxID=1442381 RepID=A0A4R5QGZ5_9PROT|nr:hypothetical protein [Dankookia rubra]TDH62213.1 hypothetical protein E2C06_12545 [Dankookia rubra]